MPPGELMYIAMSLVGFSDSRNRSCEQTSEADAVVDRSGEEDDAPLQQARERCHRLARRGSSARRPSGRGLPSADRYSLIGLISSVTASRRPGLPFFAAFFAAPFLGLAAVFFGAGFLGGGLSWPRPSWHLRRLSSLRLSLLPAFLAGFALGAASSGGRVRSGFERRSPSGWPAVTCCHLLRLKSTALVFCTGSWMPCCMVLHGLAGNAQHHIPARMARLPPETGPAHFAPPRYC